MWLEILKDKASPSFICIAAVFHVVFSLYTMHIFSLQFTVQFLLYAADIHVFTGLFVAGSFLQGFSPGIINAHLKHVNVTVTQALCSFCFIYISDLLRVTPAT